MIDFTKLTNHQIYLWNKDHKLNKHCERCGESICDRNVSNLCVNCIRKYYNPACLPSVRKKISSSMKLAHLEGRAYTIGNNDRKKNIFSRPEKWLNDVLKNNNITSFSHEVRVGKYFLDFCNTFNKYCIEIDGEQHTRYPQKLRDVEKDEYLKTKGYNLVRVSWKDCCNNSKDIANDIVTFVKTGNSEKLNTRYVEYNQTVFNNILYNSFNDEFSILDLLNISSKDEYIYK